MNRRAFPIAVALAALAACGGDDDTAADTSGPPTTTTSTSADASVTTNPATTTTPSTTAPPTTAAPTTSTIPPIAALTIEQLGDLPGRGVERVLNAGGTIIAVAEVEDPDNTVNYSLLRIDPATGTVAQELLLDLSSSITDLVTAGDRHVVYGAFQTGPLQFECRIRTLDPTTLTLDAGVLIADEFTQGSNCDGRIIADDITPGVVWHWAPYSLYASRVDLTTGVVERVTLPVTATLYPAGLDVAGGNAYVTLLPPFGSLERDALESPDGLLRSNVVRIDAASKQITGPQEVAGAVSVSDGQLLVTLGDQVVQTVDPTTLIPASVDPAQFPPVPCVSFVAGDDVRWSTDTDYETGNLAVSQRDPETDRVVATGEIAIGFDPAIDPDGPRTIPAAVGAELFVFAAAEGHTADGIRIHTTRIFRTTAV